MVRVLVAKRKPDRITWGNNFMVNKSVDFRLLAVLLALTLSYFSGGCATLFPAHANQATRHACRWAHCPYKGETIKEYKAHNRGMEHSSAYGLDLLHLQHPAADYDQLDSMLLRQDIRFTSYRNSQFKIYESVYYENGSRSVVYSVMDTVRRCKGTTKAGNPCRSTFVGKDGYCRYHSPTAIHCAHPGCRMVVKEAGGFCRFHNSHAVHIDKRFQNKSGYVSVWFTQDGKKWGLDDLTVGQYDSLLAIK